MVRGQLFSQSERKMQPTHRARSVRFRLVGRVIWGFGRFQAKYRGPVIKFDPAVFRSIQIEDALKKFVRPLFS